MKKIFRVLLSCFCCVALLFSAVACSTPPQNPDGYKTVDTYNEKSTEQIYTDIMTYVNEHNNNFTAAVTYDIDINIEMTGVEIPATALMIDTIKVDDGAFYEYASMSLTCESAPNLNQYLFAELWFVDDVAYLNNPRNSGSQKIKVDTDWAEFCEEAGIDSNNVSNPIYDFSDSSFDKVKFYVDKNVEDSKVVDPYFELEISGTRAEEFAAKRISNLGNQIQNPVVKVSTVKYKFYITEEGNLDYVGIIYTLTLTGKIQGFDVSYEYNYDGILEFKDVGTTQVDPPADANDYDEGIFM